MKIYIAPLQDLYSGALPGQANKNSDSRTWNNLRVFLGLIFVSSVPCAYFKGLKTLRN